MKIDRFTLGFPYTLNNLRVISIVLAVTLGFGVGCATKKPPPIEGDLWAAFSRFSASLQTAVAAGGMRDVEVAIEDWTSKRPAIAPEGDLYASLLTSAPEYMPHSGWQAIANALVARFPQHPSLWLGQKTLLAARLAEQDAGTAIEIWDQMTRAPVDVRSRLAGRIGEELWQLGQGELSIRWSLRASPAAKSGPAGEKYWSLLLDRAWVCCEAPAFSGTPVGQLLELKQALHASDRPAMTKMARQLARELEKKAPQSLWIDLARRLATAEVEAAAAASTGVLTVVAPLNGPQQGLGRAAGDVIVACLAPHQSVEFLDSRGRAGGALAALAESDAPFLLGPFRTNELQAASFDLFLDGRSALTPNPVALSELPLSGSIWSAAISPEDQARAVAQTVLAQGWKAVAMLVPNSPYGQRFVETMWDAVIDGGGWFTGVEHYETGSADYGKPLRALVGLDRYSAEDLRQMKDEKREPAPIIDFEVLILAGSAGDLALLPAQLAFHDIYNVRIVGDSGLNSPRVGELAREYVHGSLFVAPALVTDAVEGATERCISQANSNPGGLEYAVFDATRFLAEVQRRGTTPTAFSGALGTVNVAENRTFVRKYAVYQWRRGRIVPWDGLDPLELYRQEMPVKSTPSEEVFPEDD